MCLLGSFFIFLGYLAVIAGSRLHISQPSDVTAMSVAVFSALLGACGGAITTFVLRRACAKCFGHHLPLLNVLFGATAGIVSSVFINPAKYPCNCSGLSSRSLRRIDCFITENISNKDANTGPAEGEGLGVGGGGASAPSLFLKIIKSY